MKIKIISLSVLNRYFFENHQLCILSYLIESYRILSYQFLVPIFQSRPCLFLVSNVFVHFSVKVKMAQFSFQQDSLTNWSVLFASMVFQSRCDGAMLLCLLGNLSSFLFVNLAFCQLGILSTWHFFHLAFCPLGILSIGILCIWHFNHLAFCPLGTLSP